MEQDLSDAYRGSGGEPEIIKSPLQSSSNSLPIRERTGKRRAGDFTASTVPPLKRVKGDFNAAYLNLLNQDIEDVSSGLLRADDDPGTERTQVGAVLWSATEKNIFFAALSRLGKEDAVGISTRIRTKSEIEVRQYLALIEEADRRQRDEVTGRGRHVLRPVDVPAAAEISAECAAALEAAADAIALRQESYEEDVERDRWGSRWLVSASLVRELEHPEEVVSQPLPLPLERGQEERQRSDGEGERMRQPSQRQGVQRKKRKASDEPPFTQLFSLQDWLELSERIFMNSSVSDGNWRSVADESEPPAVQATAFADFYNLTLSITKRLIFAAMWVADSRLRVDNRDDMRKPKGYHVRAEDVAAAVSSLGMRHDAREFWARCSRRIQLNIVDDGFTEDDFTDGESEETDAVGEGGNDRDSHFTTTTTTTGPRPDYAAENEPDTEDSEDENHETMSYDEVETALGYPKVDNLRSTPEPYPSTSSSEGVSDHDSSDSENIENRRSADKHRERNPEDDDDDNEDEPDNDLLNANAIAQDIEEALLASSSLYPAKHGSTSTAPPSRGLKAQIRAEHRLERDAELLDAKTSATAEAGLWAVLRGEAGTGGRKKKKEERGRR